jgi:hypothetical protein
MSYVDLDARMSIGFVPNRWISGPHEQTRSRAVIAAAYASLSARAASGRPLSVSPGGL